MSVINSVFDAQIEPFILEYPCFQKKTVGNVSFLKGILDIPNDEGVIAGSFSIEIHPVKNFPFAFPILYEVGNEIPREADWHKYANDSCCLTVPAKERLICKNGITLVWFVQNVVVPYFSNQLYKKQNGNYLQEYSHNEAGIKEFYEELFLSSDLKVWALCIKNTFGNVRFHRNEKCYCNSGKKYKKCHLLVENDVRTIGREQIVNDFKKIGLI